MCQAGSRNTRSQVRVSVPRQQSLYPPSVKTILLASIIAVAGLWLALLETVSAKLRVFRAPEFMATAFMFAVLGLLVHLLLGA